MSFVVIPESILRRQRHSKFTLPLAPSPVPAALALAPPVVAVVEAGRAKQKRGEKELTAPRAGPVVDVSTGRSTRSRTSGAHDALAVVASGSLPVASALSALACTISSVGSGVDKETADRYLKVGQRFG